MKGGGNEISAAIVAPDSTQQITLELTPPADAGTNGAQAIEVRARTDAETLTLPLTVRLSAEETSAAGLKLEPELPALRGTARSTFSFEGVLAKAPDHPWAIHLYIHLVEASDRPERGEPYTGRLAALMPGAGHIVHMPSHIYFRVGRYVESLEANKTASKVDESYISETGAMGVYPIGYYSHNVHFVLVSAQLLGDKDTVLSEADKLDKWLSNDVATAIPIAQPVKAAPYFAWAQYADADKILALPDPPSAPPYIKAMWHYARGVALAAKKDVAGARKKPTPFSASCGKPTGRCWTRGPFRRAPFSKWRKAWFSRVPHRPRATPRPLSTFGARLPKSRTQSPIWSRPSGIIRSGNRSAPRCSRTGRRRGREGVQCCA